MIKPVTVYMVYCDGCGKLFDNEEPPMRMNEAHMYTSVKRAMIGIQVVGWAVFRNLEDNTKYIACPKCAKNVKPIMAEITI
jgi:hypothetical protein